MTIQRMIELLEVEHECMLRGAHDDCDRDCANCELVQDDGDLHEMYTDVIALLKEQEIMSPDKFKGKILCMFSSIWDCEIDHPVFQDKVGELMDAVVDLYRKAVKWNDSDNNNGCTPRLLL